MSSFITEIKVWLSSIGVTVDHEKEQLTAEEYEHVHGILGHRFGLNRDQVVSGLHFPSTLPLTFLEMVRNADPEAAAKAREEAEAKKLAAEEAVAKAKEEADAAAEEKARLEVEAKAKADAEEQARLEEETSADLEQAQADSDAGDSDTAADEEAEEGSDESADEAKEPAENIFKQ